MNHFAMHVFAVVSKTSFEPLSELIYSQCNSLKNFEHDLLIKTKCIVLKSHHVLDDDRQSNRSI